MRGGRGQSSTSPWSWSPMKEREREREGRITCYTCTEHRMFTCVGPRRNSEPKNTPPPPPPTLITWWWLQKWDGEFSLFLRFHLQQLEKKSNGCQNRKHPYLKKRKKSHLDLWERCWGRKPNINTCRGGGSGVLERLSHESIQMNSSGVTLLWLQDQQGI